MAQPHVIYQAKPGSALEVNRDFYARLAPDAGKRTLMERFVIPRRSGRAWPVRAGQIVRIVAVEGPQVADLNVWNLANPRERFWASRTRQLHQAHVTTFDRLWSCRSEERRVGEECRSRWSPDHLKKKKKRK